MNPIEEMMEKYGVKKKLSCISPKNFNCVYCSLYDSDKMHCKRGKRFPLFTPKKQIDLLIYILNVIDIVISAPRAENGDIFCKLDIVNKSHKSFIGLDFGKALATLVRSCYTDFTPTQKQQIKEILEG